MNSATIETNTGASFKRSWTKSNGKPKRPLSAYNLYFQVERARILKFGMRREDPLVYRPEEVVKMSNWHKVRPRRPHRRSHGRVSFHDMARIISGRWKDLDQRNLQVFVDQAKLEKADYKRRVKAWEAGENSQASVESSQHEEEQSASSLPQHEQNTTMTEQHDENNNNDERAEQQCENIVVSLDDPTTLSFQTSGSSIESVETAESVDTTNDEFWNNEMSTEFLPGEMATVADSRRRVSAATSAYIEECTSFQQPDYTETDVSTSSNRDEIVELYQQQQQYNEDLPTAMTLCDESLFDELTEQVPPFCDTYLDNDNLLAGVSEADLMDALLLFDD